MPGRGKGCRGMSGCAGPRDRCYLPAMMIAMTALLALTPALAPGQTTGVVTGVVTGVPADDVEVRARMGDGILSPGTTHTFTVEFVVPEGTTASEAGLPSPFLQLDVPPGVTLTEPPSEKEHISMPFERMIEGASVEIPFAVDEGLAADATLGLVVTAYLSDDETKRFLRRRLELPLSRGAVAREGDADDSSWGPTMACSRSVTRWKASPCPWPKGSNPSIWAR